MFRAFSLKTVDVSDIVLGRGSFSDVFRGTLRSSQTTVAVKVIKEKSMGQTDLLEREVAVLKKLNQRNIVRLLDTELASLTPNVEQLCLILEFCDLGTLEKVMTTKNGPKKMTEGEAKLYIIDILQGLSYLHSLSVIHRDMKPDNLLLCTNPYGSRPILKISDFGLAKTLGDEKSAHTMAGTPYYLAPEVAQAHYDEKVDIWSMGVILFRMLFGMKTFGGVMGRNDTLITKTFSRATIAHLVTAKCADFLEMCLKANPLERPPADALLEDPWLTDFFTPPWADLPPALPSTNFAEFFDPNTQEKLRDLPAPMKFDMKNFVTSTTDRFVSSLVGSVSRGFVEFTSKVLMLHEVLHIQDAFDELDSQYGITKCLFDFCGELIREGETISNNPDIESMLPSLRSIFATLQSAERNLRPYHNSSVVPYTTLKRRAGDMYNAAEALIASPEEPRDYRAAVDHYRSALFILLFVETDFLRHGKEIEASVKTLIRTLEHRWSEYSALVTLEEKDYFSFEVRALLYSPQALPRTQSGQPDMRFKVNKDNAQ